MADLDRNPLLADDRLPAFEAIRAEHVVPAVQRALAEARDTLAAVLAAPGPPSRESLLLPMERALERLERVWSPVRHLHSTMDSPALREAYEACLPLLTRFHTELAQDRALFEAYQALAGSEAGARLPAAERRALDNALREFRLGGVALGGEARARFAAAASRLSELGSRFANNVPDATEARTLDGASGDREQGEARDEGAEHREQRGSRDRILREGHFGYR